MSPLPPSRISADQYEFSRGEFSQDDRALLLRLAHQSILSALGFVQKNSPASETSPHSTSEHLKEPRGVFTSLYLRGELRGCVGYVLPTGPVYQAVEETARAAAFEDTRFRPVTREEAPHLKIELSILSTPQPLSPEAIEIGRHGLLITMDGRRGLLLPQVPVERHWDRITFLEQTCRKAGLPMDAWRQGATIEAFTAEVFRDGSD